MTGGDFRPRGRSDLSRYSAEPPGSGDPAARQARPNHAQWFGTGPAPRM